MYATPGVQEQVLTFQRSKDLKDQKINKKSWGE